MTIQVTQMPGPVSSAWVSPEMGPQMGPPVAPMAMPKQVLTPEQGLMRRALAPLFSRLTLWRHALRRAG